MRKGIDRLAPLGTVLAHGSELRSLPNVEVSPVTARDWEAAVGSRIAARARPIKLDRGVLHVRTASATWAQELTLLSETIVAQLAARGVAVKALRFRVGDVKPPERPPSRSTVRTAPPAVRLPQPIREELLKVQDPDLRECIAVAAAKNLGWQKTAARPQPVAERKHRRPETESVAETTRVARSAGDDRKRSDVQPPKRRKSP